MTLKTYISFTGFGLDRVVMKITDIIVVTGLPRSGTSLTMQILQAAGIEIFTDNKRRPDISNPKGYFEHELVKKIQSDSSWMKDVKGKAIKIVSPLLAYLPVNYNYKIIFVERDLLEIIQSQEKMISELDSEDEKLKPEILKRIFNKNVERTKKWINSQSNMKCLNVSYFDIVNNFEEEIFRIEKFLNVKINKEKTKLIIDKKLYRSRIN